MAHMLIEQYLEDLAEAWPASERRDDALAELRDHLEAAFDAACDNGADDEVAAQRAVAECGPPRELIWRFCGSFHQRRARWIMRLTAAGVAASVACALGIAAWWPGEAPPAFVNQVLAQAPGGIPGVPPAGPPTVTAPKATSSLVDANNLATQQKLAKTIAADFKEIPLAEVLAHISDATEVEHYLNIKALGDARISADSPVTVSLKKVRAEMLLDLALQQVGGGAVDYVIRDGILIITTTDSLDGASEVKAYPVADLLRLQSSMTGSSDSSPAPVPGSAPGGSPFGTGAPGSAAPGIPSGAGALTVPGLGGGGGLGGAFGGDGGPVVPQRKLPDDVRQLIDVMQNTVSPDSWRDNGGVGSITYYGDMLVVRQSARNHREVEKVLTLLRETAKKSVRQ